MDNQIKRLLISEKPFPDESFIGYLVRLAEMNAIPDYRWIYNLMTSAKPNTHRLSIKTNLRIERAKFARLSGITQRDIKRLLYEEETIFLTQNYDLVIHGQIIEAHYINQEKPKICPACLAEQNYCRRIWEFLPLVVCPSHKCLLIEQCPQCLQKIDWGRPGLAVCCCGFDYRQAELTPVTDSELRFGRYFYQKLKYNFAGSTVALEYPLSDLSIKNLLKLLLFAGSHLSGISHFTRQNTLANYAVQQIHEMLCEAIEVFDKWSYNYHCFVDEWEEKFTTYEYFRKPVRFPDNPVPVRYKKYESLIWELDCFDEEEFEFLHCEFLNCL